MSYGIPNTPESFWSRVERGEGCWLWTGATSRSHYGALGWNGKIAYAHRIAWALTNGPIPDGLRVLHHCDNPPCVNPAHLWLGTAADNSQDMARKGRMAQQKDPSRAARGARWWSAKRRARFA